MKHLGYFISYCYTMSRTHFKIPDFPDFQVNGKPVYHNSAHLCYHKAKIQTAHKMQHTHITSENTDMTFSTALRNTIRSEPTAKTQTCHL